jgi:O-succinylhomoserine sulfhydrylase
LKSLETLELRMRQHCENAMKVADFLSHHKKVTRVLYPFRADHPQHNLARAQMDGGGGVVSFEIEGGKAAVFRCANALQLIDISNNLGDAKSLFTHPETTTHQKMTQEARDAGGVTSGLVRLSVGLEDPDDLCEDLDQALKVA